MNYELTDPAREFLNRKGIKSKQQARLAYPSLCRDDDRWGYLSWDDIRSVYTWITDGAFSSLSTRTRNVIEYADIFSMDELRAKVTSGQMLRMRGYGRKTHEEVLGLLGIPIAFKKDPGISECKICPTCGNKYRSA